MADCVMVGGYDNLRLMQVSKLVQSDRVLLAPDKFDSVSFLSFYSCSDGVIYGDRFVPEVPYAGAEYVAAQVPDGGFVYVLSRSLSLPATRAPQLLACRGALYMASLTGLASVQSGSLILEDDRLFRVVDYAADGSVLLFGYDDPRHDGERWLTSRDPDRVVYRLAPLHMAFVPTFVRVGSTGLRRDEDAGPSDVELTLSERPATLPRSSIAC